MSTTFTAGILDSYQAWLNNDSEKYLNALSGMYEDVYGIVVDQGDPNEPDFVPGWSAILDPSACPSKFLPFLAQFVGVSIPPSTNEAVARALIKGESGMQRGTAAAMQIATMRNLEGWSTDIANTSQEIATITAPLPTQGKVTEIPIHPTTNLAIAGSIKISSGGHEQTFIATGSTADAISIVAATPNYAYPVGSLVRGPWMFFRERLGLDGFEDAYHVFIGFNPAECPDPAALVAAVEAVKPAGIQVSYVSSTGFVWAEAIHTWAEDNFSWDSALATQP